MVSWLNSQGQSVVDRSVELGAEHRLGCRLMAWRVPQEMAARRRQQQMATSRKKGRQPTEASLAACEWEFLVTNLGEQKPAFKEAIVLYRARWTVEVLFKRWKSQGLIALLDGSSDMVTMVRLWARFCAALILHWLTVLAGWSPTLNLSFSKIARQARDFAKDIAMSLSLGTSPIDLPQKFCDMTRVGSKQNSRRKKPGTIQLLRDPEKLE